MLLRQHPGPLFSRCFAPDQGPDRTFASDASWRSERRRHRAHRRAICQYL